MKSFRTYSSKETTELGREFAGRIARPHKGATVLALRGELGAGKTTFTQGFARGLGIKRRMMSPTFIIMRRFKIPARQFKNLYHIDAYRLKSSDAQSALGLENVFADPTAIVLVEWPERLKLPKGVQKIMFRHGKKENERIISLPL